MLAVSWIAWGLLGKLLMYVFRKQPLSKRLRQNKTMEELISCDLCLGVWVYSILFGIFRQDFLQGYITYLPVVSELISGIVTSFVAYLVTSGWKANFEVIQITADGKQIN